MEFLATLDKVIAAGFDSFKMFINKEIAENANFLESFFLVPPNGRQMTILNYLIHLYPGNMEEDQQELTQAIALRQCMDYVMQLSLDNNVGEPLHQAIASKKIVLALHLLQGKILITNESKVKLALLLNKARTHSAPPRFDMNKRDDAGRSLLFLALETRDLNLLLNILNNHPNVHMPTRMAAAKTPFQPLHQAIVMNFAEAIRLLVSKGASLSNGHGNSFDTAILLASRLGQIESLEALLEAPVQQLSLNVKNKRVVGDNLIEHTAMDELCLRLKAGKEKSGALQGVAMLLCHGAKPPRDTGLRNLLGSNRLELLKAIHRYLENKPELVDDFVARCHLAESPLHDIIYANHSWGNAIRHLFGLPSEVAFIVENLMVRKYSNSEENPAALPTAVEERFASSENPQKLYALFVKRYREAYESQRITNCWSTMRWMIAEGKCDWNTVLRYSKNHPTSRTRLILNEMLQPQTMKGDEPDAKPEIARLC